MTNDYLSELGGVGVFFNGKLRGSWEDFLLRWICSDSSFAFFNFICKGQSRGKILFYKGQFWGVLDGHEKSNFHSLQDCISPQRNAKNQARASPRAPKMQPTKIAGVILVRCADITCPHCHRHHLNHRLCHL